MNTISNTFEKIVSIAKGGKIFRVDFIKKDGTPRTMVCRLGVTKHLRGGENTCSHKPNILTVFDMQVRDYRNINLETVKSIHGGGKHFTVG